MKKGFLNFEVHESLRSKEYMLRDIRNCVGHKKDGDRMCSGVIDKHIFKLLFRFLAGLRLETDYLEIERKTARLMAKHTRGDNIGNLFRRGGISVMYLFIFLFVKSYIGVGKRTKFRTYKAFERYCIRAGLYRMSQDPMPFRKLESDEWMLKYISMIIGDLPVRRERLTFYYAVHRLYMLGDIGGGECDSPYDANLRDSSHVGRYYRKMLGELTGIENKGELTRLASTTFRFICIPAAICYALKSWSVMIEELINYLGYYGGHIGWRNFMAADDGTYGAKTYEEHHYVVNIPKPGRPGHFRRLITIHIKSGLTVQLYYRIWLRNFWKYVQGKAIRDTAFGIYNLSEMGCKSSLYLISEVRKRIGKPHTLISIDLNKFFDTVYTSGSNVDYDFLALAGYNEWSRNLEDYVKQGLQFSSIISVMELISSLKEFLATEGYLHSVYFILYVDNILVINASEDSDSIVLHKLEKILKRRNLSFKPDKGFCSSPYMYAQEGMRYEGKVGRSYNSYKFGTDGSFLYTLMERFGMTYKFPVEKPKPRELWDVPANFGGRRGKCYIEGCECGQIKWYIRNGGAHVLSYKVTHFGRNR